MVKLALVAEGEASGCSPTECTFQRCITERLLNVATPF